jgi:hypothetical protein
MLENPIQALADPACSQCPQFVIQTCRSKAKEAFDVITAVNDMIVNKSFTGTLSTHVDLLLNYPSELKNFGNSVVDNTKSLQKMIQMIQQTKA